MERAFPQQNLRAIHGRNKMHLMFKGIGSYPEYFLDLIKEETNKHERTMRPSPCLSPTGLLRWALRCADQSLGGDSPDRGASRQTRALLCGLRLGESGCRRGRGDDEVARHWFIHIDSTRRHNYYAQVFKSLNQTIFEVIDSIEKIGGDIEHPNLV